MPHELTHNPAEYQFRARLPLYLRVAAIIAIAVTVLVVVVGFYRERSRASFRLKGEHVQLSKDVVADVSGYERVEAEDGVNKYYIRAERAKTFADDHQEFENVYLEAFDASGKESNKMRADSGIYVPEPDKNFTAYFRGNVKIESIDGLNVRSNSITYTRNSETADADDVVEFEVRNIKGTSFGARVYMRNKQLELLRDVGIEAFESAELGGTSIRYAKINADSAKVDQIAGKADLLGSILINVTSKGRSPETSQNTEIRANKAIVTFSEAKSTADPPRTVERSLGKNAQLNKFELFEAVRIVNSESGSPTTSIEAGYALYDRVSDRFEAKDAVHIISVADGKNTDINAEEAVFDRAALKMALDGGVEITQGGDYLRGDVLFADLYADNKIKYALIRGNAFAKQKSDERTISISAPELNASFNNRREMQNANAIGSSIAEIIPVKEPSYTRVAMNSTRGIGLAFKGNGLLDAMRTDGRTTINLTAPDTDPDAANKRVTADSIRTVLAANGKDIVRAEAIGNAELNVEPRRVSKDTYRTTANAPRFDCEFFPTGNNARLCTAGKKARAVRIPTVQTEGRGNQNITADQLTARFSESTKDIEVFDASGAAKFTELDRIAVARQMTFTQSDGVVRLRGGEPTAWDSRARGKAAEIDWDTKGNKTFFRGGVSTTYYSRKQMRDSTPFAASDKPVYMTAENAVFDHTAETALYTQDARGWQEDNFVRGNRVFIDQKAGTLFAEGNVQSMLYNAKTRQKTSTVPVSASSHSLSYARDTRLLQYRISVDIRQGTDRIIGGSADIYLNEQSEISKTIVESNVVITQPGRKATGEWVQYTAVDELVIIRGNPATVSDTENGTTQGSQLTVYMRDNRVLTEGKSKQNTAGRTRTVYKTKPNQ